MAIINMTTTMIISASNYPKPQKHRGTVVMARSGTQQRRFSLFASCLEGQKGKDLKQYFLVNLSFCNTVIAHPMIVLEQKITIRNRFQDQFVPLSAEWCDLCGTGSQHDAGMTDTQETSQNTSYLFPI